MKFNAGVLPPHSPANTPQAYRGVLPADRWHEPYMSKAELDEQIAAGVTFWAATDPDGTLIAVMGIQPVKDVHLIRHAYVDPAHQGQGTGGFRTVSPTEKDELLRRYWDIPARQIETSLVLTSGR